MDVAVVSCLPWNQMVMPGCREHSSSLLSAPVLRTLHGGPCDVETICKVPAAVLLDQEPHQSQEGQLPEHLFSFSDIRLHSLHCHGAS